jgi:tetratricopeptide (TPR) repeat protein
MGLVAFLLFLQATDYSAEGLKALEAQKYEQAEQLFTKAAEADPKDYSAWFNLAFAQSQLNKDAEATAGYKKVLELKPGLYQAELNLGVLLLRQKRANEALAHLKAASDLKPNEQRPIRLMAEAEVEIGRGLAAGDRLGEGAPHFHRAVEIDPGFKNALLELASLYEARKQFAEAIEIYKQFPENVAAKERLGELLLESGKTDDAILQLEAALKTSPTSANRVALAAAYLRSKQTAKGAALLREAVEAEPANVELRMMYGRALRDQRILGPASQEFARAAQLKPDSKEAWSELAGALILLEQYQPALVALDKTRALGGETAAYYYFRAIVLDRLKDYKPALESYEKFLAMSKDKNPDEEFKARQRIRVIQKEMSKH